MTHLECLISGPRDTGLELYIPEVLGILYGVTLLLISGKMSTLRTLQVSHVDVLGCKFFIYYMYIRTLNSWKSLMMIVNASHLGRKSLIKCPQLSKLTLRGVVADWDLVFLLIQMWYPRRDRVGRGSLRRHIK